MAEGWARHLGADQIEALSAGIRKEHWPLDDPAKAIGADEEVIAVFRECRDDIRYRVEDLLVRLKQDIRERSDEC